MLISCKNQWNTPCFVENERKNSWKINAITIYVIRLATKLNAIQRQRILFRTIQANDKRQQMTS